jgi:DNA-directed RNA polymerase specialized sigma24 family protein
MPDLLSAFRRFLFRLRRALDRRAPDPALVHPLTQFIASLPANERQALVRYFAERWPAERVCAEFGLTREQFRLLRRRAYERYSRATRDRAQFRSPKGDLTCRHRDSRRRDGRRN